MAIRLSKTLTGNDLGILANVETLPSETEIATFVSQASEPYQYLITSGDENELHTEAQTLLSNGKLHEAWCLLLSKK